MATSPGRPSDATTLLLLLLLLLVPIQLRKLLRCVYWCLPDLHPEPPAVLRHHPRLWFFCILWLNPICLGTAVTAPPKKNLCGIFGASGRGMLVSCHLLKVRIIQIYDNISVLCLSSTPEECRCNEQGGVTSCIVNSTPERFSFLIHQLNSVGPHLRLLCFDFSVSWN